MNGSINNKNSVCNQNQVPKNLPLKKRRTYLTDTSAMDVESSNSCHQELSSNHRPTTIKQTYIQEDSLQLPTTITSTPPSSPHLELLRQQHAYFMVNAGNNQYQHLIPTTFYEYLLTHSFLAEQYYLNNPGVYVQRYPNMSLSNIPIEEKLSEMHTAIVDEHFRKSLGENYNTFSGEPLTPHNSSSNSSPTDRTPVDSIDEHFARSLGKFWPLTTEPIENKTTNATAAVVDDHFAKALGTATWEKLKEKS